MLVLCDLAGIVGAREGLLAGSLAVAGPPYVVFAALSLGYLWRRSVPTHVWWALFAPWLFVPFLCTYLAANDVLGPTANRVDSRALLFTGLFMSLSTGYMYVAMLVPFALWWNAERSWSRDVVRGALAILCAVGLSAPTYLVASAGAVTSLPYLVEQAYSPSGEVVARLHALPEDADAPYGEEVRMARAATHDLLSARPREEWSHLDSNQGPPACEAGALTS